MCNPACIRFGQSHIFRDDVAGKKVIEVGAFDHNGSLRSVVQPYGPSSYVGVDIAPGHGVDEICDITELVARYGTESFDVVVCTEVIEHVRDWRAAVTNLKNILRPNGMMIVTTRSKGYPYHGHPHDFWRYEVADMGAIFSDCTIEANEPDLSMPGVFMKVFKPVSFVEANLDDYALYSTIKHEHRTSVSDAEVLLFNMKLGIRQVLRRTLPPFLKKRIKKLLFGKEHIPI
jgi:SAM-dependent methyltransferase